MNPKLIESVNELKVDHVYEVRMDDCCVSGVFVSTLVSIKPSEDGSISIDELYFSNGVFLTNFMQCSFFEIVKEYE